MIDLYDWLRELFTYPENLHPQFAVSMKKPRTKDMPSYVDREYEFKNHGLRFRIGLVMHEKNHTRLVIYAPDRKLEMESEKFVLPFKVLDCNYILYGLYLNIAAYLIAVDNAKLDLILPCEPNKKEVTFLYRPEIAKAILEWKAKNEKERTSNSASVHERAGQVGLFQ